MNFSVLAAIFAFALSAVTTMRAADSNFDRTLNAGAAPYLSVSTGSGYIRMHPGSDSQVHIVGHVHSSHDRLGIGSEADARIQQIVKNPPIVQSGNDITVGERHNNDLYRGITIDYEITLPRNSAIAAVTGSGDVDIQDVGANLKAQSGSGSIRAHDIKGSAFLGTGSGDIELQQIASGEVKAETGSGNIRLRGLSSALKATTGSGDIDVNGQPSNDWKISTGSGSIRLAVGSTRFNLNADTGSGNINVAQPLTMQGSLNRHHVSGIVNGGGPIIRASTGSGDIQIR